MSEIKSGKIPAPAGHRTWSIPLKTGSNGQELSEIRSIFVRDVSEHCQLTVWIDGIDRNFLFGNGRPPCSHPGSSPFPSFLGATQVSQGLALVHTNCYIVYLDFETTLGRFGEGFVSLTPGWWGGKTPYCSCYR